MSHETRPSVAKTHPELVDTDYDQEEEHEQQSSLLRRRRFLIGAGATFATLMLAGGLALGLRGGDSESTEPRADAGTSASANPNTAAPTPAETASTAPETNPANWNAENIPLYTDIDGNGTPETYTGQEALVDAFELKVADYANPDDAAAAFVSRMNTLINWGANAETRKTYQDAGVASKDGEWAGASAVREDYVIPAFNEAMFGTPQNGVDMTNDQRESWMQTQIDLSRQTLSRFAQSEGNQYPYFMKYELDESRAGVEHLGGEEAKGYYQYWIDVKAVDNTAEAQLPPELGAEPVEGAPTWSVGLQRQGDTWKVIGVGNK